MAYYIWFAAAATGLLLRLGSLTNQLLLVDLGFLAVTAANWILCHCTEIPTHRIAWHRLAVPVTSSAASARGLGRLSRQVLCRKSKRFTDANQYFPFGPSATVQRLHSARRRQRRRLPHTPQPHIESCVRAGVTVCLLVLCCNVPV